MPLVRPRLVDYFGIPVTQEEVDFAIPFLDEDIPLYVDPFLLWRSPSQQDFSLHSLMINAFNALIKSAEKDRASTVGTLIALSECTEAGLGNGKTKRGARISSKTAESMIDLFNAIPQYRSQGIPHIEEIQMLVENISKDRISDFTCSILKSFLIDYTQDQCKQYSIPMMAFQDQSVFNAAKCRTSTESIVLPYNPEELTPVLFIPKRWLRIVPWINSMDYFAGSYIPDSINTVTDRAKVLMYNRANYDVISAYIASKEREKDSCRNDPLFKQIPIISVKKSVDTILKLPTGKTDNADKKYEDNCSKLFASLLYPHLDFAQSQSRTDSGTQIRDLVFYNNRSYPFLSDLYEQYDCRQIVIEMKNVHELTRENINQLNRYLSEQFGRFGIIITRNPIKKKLMQNTIDLWSGQRRCIIVLSDSDLKMMVDVYESRQRDPIEVIKKSYVEFTRQCPN